MSDATNDSTDELLSADLDGETTPAEHDRIAADPERRSRQAELGSASRLAGQKPPALDTAMVDDSISRALDALPTNDVGPLIHRREPGRRRSARSGPVPWLVAAAAVLLGAIGLRLIITAKPPSQRAAKSTAGAAHRSGTTTTPLSSAPEAASAAPLASLGDFASSAALRSALAARTPPARSTTSADRSPKLSAGQGDRCATVIEARNPQLLRSNRRAVVSATIAGESVLVLEYQARAVTGSARQTTRVIAMGAAACDERLDFER